MRRSTSRLLTTHVGSLPQPDGCWVHAAPTEGELRASIPEVLRKQRECGLDVINDGEFAQGVEWQAGVDRFTGFEPSLWEGPALAPRGREREAFAEFYELTGNRTAPAWHRRLWWCTGPVAYSGYEPLQRQLDLLSEFAKPIDEVFVTTTTPAGLEAHRRNEYYNTQEEFLFALAAALRTEYELIAGAGFIVQVDDPWLASLWDRIGIPMGLEAFRAWCMIRVEALNYALANIPVERIRYHLCWGNWHGPHAHDLEMRQIVDIMLRVRAGAYLFESANARHEHEYAVWERVRLPEGKIIVPGVVTDSTDVIEHPELVAQRILRFAQLVGRENVIAGADCGLRSLHPEIAWAKLAALVEGADMASARLGYSHSQLAS